MKDRSKRFAKKAAARKSRATKAPAVCRPQFNALRADMRVKIRQAERKHSNKYRHMCKREAENFVQWAIEQGYRPEDLETNDQKVSAGRLYVGHLYTKGVPLRDNKGAIILDRDGNAIYRPCAASSAQQYSKGVAVALGVDWRTLDAGKVAIKDKTRSTGRNERAIAARYSAQNARVVRFCELVGARRGVVEKLTGADWCCSSSGQWGVRLLHDKHGKNNFHVVAPSHISEVAGYFAGIGPNDLVFGPIDPHLDLHGIRAEHARAELERYTELCKDPAYRQNLRDHLIARYVDPTFGNATYLSLVNQGKMDKAQRNLAKFIESLDCKSPYVLRGEDRALALERDMPIRYDRLALTATSVFAVDHWRNTTTVKFYVISS